MISPLILLFFVHTAFGQDNTTAYSIKHIIQFGTGAKTVIPTEFYQKAHSYFTQAQIYRNYTLEDTKNHVDGTVNWKAPLELHEKFPYYQSGYDYEDQPVWILEVGKYNIREQIQKGPLGAYNLSEYLYQAFFRILESIVVRDTPTKEIRGVFLILDWEGFDFTQGAHAPTVQFALNLLRTYTEILAVIVDRAVIINVTYFANLLFQYFRPILGGVFERIDLYGTNKSKWKIALHKILPLSAIPTWYGGSKDFKPIQVFG